MTEEPDTLKRRIKRLRNGLGITGKAMAEKLRVLVGTKSTQTRISDWETGREKPSAGTLAAISLLHRSPVECLKWLREGGEMPRLHVDRNERGSDDHQPEVNRAHVLEAIEAVNRFAVELAEILRRDDQQPPEEDGPAPEPAPGPDPKTRAAIAEAVKKIAEHEEGNGQEAS